MKIATLLLGALLATGFCFANGENRNDEAAKFAQLEARTGGG